MKTSPLAAAAALLLALGLGACSAGGDQSAADRSTGGMAAPEQPAAAMAAGSDMSAESAAGEAVPAAPGVGTVTPGDVDQAKVISTGTVSLEADDVRATRNDVQRVADQYGGHLSDEDMTTDDDGRADYARLVLRIPVTSYDDARADLEDLADLVSSTTKSTDVTTQVDDVDERVKAMRASLDRLRALLGAATKVSDVIRIESEVTSREADLNSLLSQQASLADQTSLSTITVDISRPRAAKTTSAEKRTGFLAGLSSGWHGLTSFATGVAQVAGVVLPWLPVALVVGIPVWLLVRRLRKAGRTARTPSAA